MKKEDLEKKIMDDYSGTFIKETIGKFAVDDFKASLREEIQNRIGALKIYGNIPNGWKAEGFRGALQLIDTIKPKIE